MRTIVKSRVVTPARRQQPENAVVLALVFALGLMVVPMTQGQSYSEQVLHNFSGSPDGGNPTAGLIVDAKGTLYGTTTTGGKSACEGNGCGVVFKSDPTGKVTILHSFTGGHDGAHPNGALIVDNAGNLYGTTGDGGKGSGFGTLFKVNTSTRKFTVVYVFAGGKDARFPQGDLTMDSAGNIYGTSYGGGEYPTVCTDLGCGTIFKVDPSGHETVLYRFTARKDGAHPRSGVDADGKGNLYGTTWCVVCSDRGTVFKLTLRGKMIVLYHFTGGADGGIPQSGLALDASGNLYSTTYEGGEYGDGTVFKVDPSGKETVLHSFNGTDGANPSENDRLVWDKNGNLYGTTPWGGSQGWGNVFKIDTAGVYKSLFSFNYSDGGNPESGVIRDSEGNLYGVTTAGGVFSLGVVYKLTP